MENFFIMYMYRRFFMRYLNKKGEWVGQEDQEEKSEELLDRLPHNIAGVVKKFFQTFHIHRLIANRKDSASTIIEVYSVLINSASAVDNSVLIVIWISLY